MNVFSTPSVIFKVGQLDEPNGILYKVVVAQAGKVKSYFEEIDSETLSQIASLGNAKENGVKARFGHPNMCSSSFGTYIGRFKNYQIEGDAVLADLHLDEVCRSSPTGNLHHLPLLAKSSMCLLRGCPSRWPCWRPFRFPENLVGQLEISMHIQ